MNNRSAKVGTDCILSRWHQVGLFGTMLLLGFCAPARAIQTGLPVEVTVTPLVIRQGDDSTSQVTTQVTLRLPAPCYFICELRSTDKEKLVCKDIIFKKGDRTATGTATVSWERVSEPVVVEVSAFSIDAPDKSVSVKVTLQPKDAT